MLSVVATARPSRFQALAIAGRQRVGWILRTNFSAKGIDYVT